MKNHLTIIKKAGVVLLAIGLADMAFMIYCLTQQQNYSSSLNIFAVLAGIFLIRGNLSFVRLITWFLAFLLTCIIGVVIFILPFTQPIGLLVVQVKMNPLTSIGLWLWALTIIVILVWVYLQLRSESVLTALNESGLRTNIPKEAIGLGLVSVAVLCFMLNYTLNGEPGSKASKLAQEQLGPGYNYSTQSIHWSGGHGSAMVAAYNDQEIRYIPVEW